MTTKKTEVPADKVFEFEGRPVYDFTFNKQVATVFDDMVSRSVPFYHEVQHMIATLARDFAQEGTKVVDIGCSTGTTIALLDDALGGTNVQFVGLDNSHDMLAKAEKKLAEAKLKNPYTLEYCDLNKGVRIENASLITFILTLQFLRPLRREAILKQLYEGLLPGGALILFEKVTSPDTTFNRLFIQHYYDFKRQNGYSDMEIANKREALENVLIPYRMDENLDLLQQVGFKKVEVFFRWYNFCAIIAVK
jgi:tRNA (cmo5U34)-methyltransferase